MQTYIVRVYRAHPTDADSVSGIIEYIESGHKEPFHGINELESLLAQSILEGQIEIPSLMTRDEGISEKVAVI
jgi:hypothetical protein